MEPELDEFDTYKQGEPNVTVTREKEHRSGLKATNEGTYPSDRNHERINYHGVSLDDKKSKLFSFQNDGRGVGLGNGRRTQTRFYGFGEHYR